MADDSERSDPSVRRVGRKDRKNRLDTRKPLFSDEDRFAPPPTLPEEEAADADEAPDDLTVEAAPDVVETPAALRFPPLDVPAAEAAPQPAVAATPPVRRRRRWLYNLLTVFFLLASVAALAYFALIWTNPYHPLNPLPPFTPLPIIVSATPPPPTETPLPTATEPATVAPTGTFTPIAEAAQPTPAPNALPFAMSELGIDYTTHASGCAWAGIAGTVVDALGAGVADLIVRASPEDGSGAVSVRSGSAPDYGPGGFEIQVGDAPQLAPFTIQLFSADEAPLSEDYLIVTSDQCAQNVVLVQFVEAGAES